MKTFMSGHRYVQFVMSFTAGLLLMTASLFGQTSGGNIFGKVVDSSGSPIPGVTVTLTGIGAPQVFVTTSNGNYRFLSLSPGHYEVAAELGGFSTLHRAADVNISANSEIDFTMQPAVSESVTFNAEA